MKYKSRLRSILFYSVLGLLLYLFIEIIIYTYYLVKINYGNTSFEAINKKNIVYDSIRGFRFLPGTARTILIENNNLEYDNTFTINNVGVPSITDYSNKKSNKNIFRYIVFGDSHTQGYFLERNWPDLVNEKLKNNNIELYNFSIDGGGLVNWHNIFFKELLKNYEFDGIIFAVYGNNFDRDFWVLSPDYKQNINQGGYIDSIPKSQNDLLNNYKLQKGESLYKTNSEINKNKDLYLSKKIKFLPFNFYSLKLYSDLKKEIELREYLNKYNNSNYVTYKISDTYNINDFVGRYGLGKYKLLNEIMKTADSLELKVIFCNIPDKDLIFNYKSFIPANIKELMFLSEYYNAKFYNICEVFKGYEKDSLENFWFKYDGHLNQKGSEIISDAFSKFLLTNTQE